MIITKWDKQAIVKAIMSDVPKINKDKRRKEMQEAVVKLMTPECRKVYETIPQALRTYHVGVLIYNGHNYNSREIVRGDVAEKELKSLEAKYEAEDSVIRDAEYSLKCAIEACTTLKQLNDRLPEFKKYFPTEQKPVANLPALVNVVADLTKLGWPKK
jgi:cellobiose-specific phosphotransferase system component IIB